MTRRSVFGLAIAFSLSVWSLESLESYKSSKCVWVHGPTLKTGGCRFWVVIQTNDDDEPS